jgi:hypothetical protein
MQKPDFEVAHSRATSLYNTQKVSKFLNRERIVALDIPAEEFDLYPVSSDESAIPTREQRAQVSATPEQVRSHTPGCKLKQVLNQQ